MTSVTMRSFPCEEVGEPPYPGTWLEAGMRLVSQNEGLPVSSFPLGLELGVAALARRRRARRLHYSMSSWQ
jgi:hypothetical protein